MSNNPDLIHGQELFPAEYARMDAVQAVYRDALKAITSSCLKHRVLLGEDALQQAMEGLGEALYDDCSGDVDRLRENGFEESPYPENHKKLCSAAAETIMDSFRIKPIDYGTLLLEVMNITAAPSFSRGA